MSEKNSSDASGLAKENELLRREISRLEKLNAEKDRAEAALKLDESRLQALQELLDMAGEPEDKIIHFALEEAVRLTKSDVGYIAFVTNDESILEMYAWSDKATQLCQIKDQPLSYPVEHTGLWGEAVRQRKAVITNDYAAPNALKKGAPKGHINLLRHMNLPVFEGDKIAAVTGVGNKKEPYDESDVRQLNLLTSFMWRLVQRKRSQVQLQYSHDIFRSVVDGMEASLYVADMETYEVLFLNRHARERWGDATGTKCWQSLRSGREGPCSFCTNHLLVDDKGRSTGPYVWEYLNTRNNCWYECRDQAIPWLDGRLVRMEIATDITKRKIIEQERVELIDLFRSQERVDRAIRKAPGLEEMMRDVLDAMLDIFGADRAWLLHPCDPDSPFWRVPMERTVPEFPGAMSLANDLPMTEEVGAAMKLALAADEPICFDPETKQKISIPAGKEFHIQSQIIMAVHTRAGKPWLFGMHQCTHPRIWSERDKKLFTAIGRRLADSLSSLLYLRDLSLREKEFRAIFQQTFQFIALLSLEGNVIQFNRTTLDFIGPKDPARLVGIPLWQTPLWEDFPEGSKEIERAVNKAASDEFVRFETSCFSTDKMLHHFDVSIKPAKDDQGEMIYLIAEARDITELKLAENELDRLRDFLKDIIDSMPSVLISVDAKGTITQWNKEAKTRAGAKANSGLGRPLTEIFPWLEREMEKVDEAIKTGSPKKSPKTPRLVDNEIHYEDVTVYPLSSRGGAGAVIRVDDVTRQARMEEAIVQAEKMNSLGGLAAGMAHEINNPLAAVIGNVQVIKKRLETAPAKNRKVAEDCGAKIEAIADYIEKRGLTPMLDAIFQAGMRAAGIVNNMLSFSRKSESSFRRCDLASILDQCIELAATDYDFKKKYDFKKIEIVRDYDPGLTPALCECGKIQQVFLNLLRNSAEAMSEKTYPENETPRFILRTRRDGPMARIEVEDNGPGMPEDVRKRIFEPFFTTKSVDKGTGLGLSISYFIVTEHHGGTMSVVTTPGQGAKFIIRLPLE